jgi:hypothetical protein
MCRFSSQEGQRQKDFYEFKIDYIRFTIMETYHILQNRLEQVCLDYICLKAKQQKKHMKLTKNYRKIHLNGTL